MIEIRRSVLKVSLILLAILLPVFINNNIQATIEERDYLVSYESYQDKTKSIDQNDIKDEIMEDYEKLNMIKISLTNEEAKELRKEDGVEVVVPDIPIRLHSDQITWSDEMVQAPVAWDSGFTGKNVKVAILDSGIADHTELVIAGRRDMVVPGGTAGDSLGHGTAVAGIIAAKANDTGLVGIAPDVELYSVKVIDNTGVGTLSTAMSALDWSMANKMDIVNLSFGVDYTGLTELEKTYVMDMINAKGNNALNQNLLIVASSGNDGNSTGLDNISVPARGDGFLAVGAVDSSKNLTMFSSIGPSLDVVAPGVGIQTLGLNNTYVSGNGTSFAAPHIAGLAALYMEKYPNMGARAIRDMIINNTEDLGTPGFDNYYGNGLAYFNPLAEGVVLAKPTVNNITSGENTISGYNTTNSRIEITIDEQMPIRKTVSQNSDFLITLPIQLTAGQIVKVAGLDADYNRSEEVVQTVLERIIPIPTGLKAFSSGYNSINISWNSVDGSDGYELYRSNSLSGEYTLLTDTNENNYSDEGLQTNTKYYYKIKTYFLVNSIKEYSLLSSPVLSKPVPISPLSFKALSYGYDTLALSWETVSGANGYEIYRATSRTGTYSLINTVSESNYKDIGLMTDVRYYYKIRAYTLVDQIMVYSPVSKAIIGKPLPGRPIGLTLIEATNNSISFSWNPVIGSTGYEVYRTDSITGQYVKIGESLFSEYLDLPLDSNKIYYYKVRAYVSLDDRNAYGSYSPTFSTKTN